MGKIEKQTVRIINLNHIESIETFEGSTEQNNYYFWRDGKSYLWGLYKIKAGVYEIGHRNTFKSENKDYLYYEIKPHIIITYISGYKKKYYLPSVEICNKIAYSIENLIESEPKNYIMDIDSYIEKMKKIFNK